MQKLLKEKTEELLEKNQEIKDVTMQKDKLANEVESLESKVIDLYNSKNRAMKQAKEEAALKTGAIKEKEQLKEQLHQLTETNIK